MPNKFDTQDKTSVIPQLEQRIEDLSRESGDLKRQLDQLQQMFTMHNHTGIDTQRVSIWDLFALFETITTTPTLVPNTIFDQVKVYRSGSTYRLYIYDTLAGAWRYATLT